MKYALLFSMIEAGKEGQGSQIILFAITIKRTNSNERCRFFQSERVKRKLAPFGFASIASASGTLQSWLQHAPNHPGRSFRDIAHIF